MPFALKNPKFRNCFVNSSRCGQHFVNLLTEKFFLPFTTGTVSYPPELNSLHLNTREGMSLNSDRMSSRLLSDLIFRNSSMSMNAHQSRFCYSAMMVPAL